MKIAFVCIENGLTAIGFRRMAALTRRTWPHIEVLHVVPFRASSPLNRIIAKNYEFMEDPEIDAIAAHLAKSDMICVSSMSPHAAYTAELIQAVRARNAAAFVVWGGLHPIVDPDNAIQHADAVCVGEGDKAFPEFLSLYEQGKDFTRVGNFHFKKNGRVIRNPLLPLQTADELAALPYPLLGDGELIYKSGRGFVRLEPLDYVRLQGLAYDTVWSIGCPNRCIYCGNSKFLDNDRHYGRLRFPPVDHILGQIEHARRQYPHLSSVTFHDDMFMAIPLPVLREFAEKWKERIKLPFAVHGLMSRYVDAEKMRVLVAAGMFRVRMGIQSGSPRTLRFFKRPDTPESIEKAIGTIQSFSKHMMTPSYDLIVDNPVETDEDLAATIDMLYRLPRPFILNVFPLMIIPGTELASIITEKRIALPLIKQGHASNSFANAVILSLSLFHPPRKFYQAIQARLRASAGGKPVNPAVMRLLLSALNVKRALAHIRRGNFSVLPSKLSWQLWKLGIVQYAGKRILRRCSLVPADRTD